jgi:hypothetical protein
MGTEVDMTRLLNEPVLFGAAVRAVLLAAMAFGTPMTPEQLAAAMGAVEAVLALITRTLVTPNQLAEARVAAGVSPTVSRKDTQFAAAAATRTGTGDGTS